MRFQLFLFALLVLVVPAIAQEKVPDPEIERAAFKVADGFEVSLFAADPLIAKPIGMNFDSAGRLWVTSSTLYPQIRPGEVADDKIIVLEDKDGDGKAEAGKVFAEGLYVPEGVVWGDGGIYVGASTELLHFKDTDGDGKADVRRVVLSGFGTEDTHHTIHTLRWGPDGQLYFNQSIYIHSHIETPWGPRRLSGSGTWRFRPRTMELEVLTRGLVNPWGHTWDQFGQEFATDGAGSDGVSIYIPGAAYGSWGTDARRWIGGVNPGSPKYCGAEIVGGRHLPEDWQGSLITNDFRANRVVRFVLREEGAGYTAKLMSDVIKSSDKSFRPVDVKMGPDGAIYIADWYNPVINHGEVDFRSPMRDHTHGRIWRLTAKGRPLVERPKIAGEPIEKLLSLLKAPEQWTRQMARRELYERDRKQVAAALDRWVTLVSGVNVPVEEDYLEALWTYQTIDVLKPTLVETLLRSTDARLRAAATHALYFWAGRIPNAFELLAKAVSDENPRVRLNAIIALGQIRSVRAIELAMRATEQPVDRWTDYALYLTINNLKDVWLPEVAAGKFTFNGNATQLAMALQALESGEAVAPLLSLLKRGTIPPDMAAGKMIGVIAGSGGPQELAELWDYLLKTKNQQAMSAGLAALLSAANDRGVAPAVGREKVVGLIGAKEDVVALGAMRLAGAWRERGAADALIAIGRDEKRSATLRQASIESLGQIGMGLDVLAELAGNAKSDVVRVAAIRALAAMDMKGAAARAAEILSSDSALDDPGSIIGAFLARQDGGKTLASALKDKKLAVDRAKLALRYIYSTGRPEPELSELLRKSADINTQMSNLSAQQIKDLAAEIASKGDAGRGEIVFRSKATSCFTCHAIGGAGGNLGPDLSAVGSASPMEYLIESILDPNKNVKEGFEAIAITTKTNDFYAGIKVRQTEKELVLRDATSSNITIPLASIKKQQNAGSLMPSGLADLLTRQELLDLVKFMSVLGTPGHDVSAAGMVVRKWQVLDQDLGAANPVELDDTWRFSSAYSTVGGELPISELPRFRKNVVRFVVEASTPGTVSMQVNSTAGLKAYINTSDMDLKNSTLELSRGGHMISIEIDREVRSEPLKITFTEAANGAARMRIWTGR